jgi:hypothetical protein
MVVVVFENGGEYFKTGENSQKWPKTVVTQRKLARFVRGWVMVIKTDVNGQRWLVVARNGCSKSKTKKIWVKYVFLS